MNRRTLPRLSAALPCGMLLVAASTVIAQKSCPDHPIRMILPFSAGGGSTLGTDIAAKVAPDGYTLLFASAARSFSPTIYPKLPYSQDDFTAITIVNITPLMLTINPAVPAKDLKSFIALLKANPGKY